MDVIGYYGIGGVALTIVVVAGLLVFLMKKINGG